MTQTKMNTNVSYIKNLNIDIETYSDIELNKSGVHKYVQSDSFKMLLFAYSVNFSSDVKIVDIENGEEIPKDILFALTDENVDKYAFNAQFERIALSKYLGQKLDSKQWSCQMVHAYMVGINGGLKEVCEKLLIPEDKQKLKNADYLIRKFSVQNCSQIDYADEWQEFKQYCIKDVVAEMAVSKKLDTILDFTVSEHLLYQLDQTINDRGIPVDVEFAKKALSIIEQNKNVLKNELIKITGLQNPNSPIQLKKWINEKEHLNLTSLNKDELKNINFKDEDVKKALSIRDELSKTSLKKYQTLLDYEINNRIYGQIQFYGAGRTGRFAGRGIQVHNLPQNHIEDLENARNIVTSNISVSEKIDLLNNQYKNVSTVLSQLIRTLIKAPKGKTLVVADFSAIEARVIAWLSGEKWRLDVFETHGKIYEASASEMFKVPIEEVTKGSDLRQKGKISELALGYGGSVNALCKMGALNMGISLNELQPLVDTWRFANKNIVSLWRNVENACICAIKGYSYKKINHLEFSYKNYNLYIELPSKRKLVYKNAKLALGKFGKDVITYDGKNTREDTFGGKLVENIVQAISRDILAKTLYRLKDLPIIFHVHDEIVIEVLDFEGEIVLNRVLSEMSKPIKWAKGLTLKGDGYITTYYKKD